MLNIILVLVLGIIYQSTSIKAASNCYTSATGSLDCTIACALSGYPTGYCIKSSSVAELTSSPTYSCECTANMYCNSISGQKITTNCWINNDVYYYCCTGTNCNTGSITCANTFSSADSVSSSSILLMLSIGYSLGVSSIFYRV